MVYREHQNISYFEGDNANPQTYQKSVLVNVVVHVIRRRLVVGFDFLLQIWEKTIADHRNYEQSCTRIADRMIDFRLRLR